ncbi:hypothetical protein Tco_0055088 [Tanacetum coccineum]
MEKASLLTTIHLLANRKKIEWISMGCHPRSACLSLEALKPRCDEEGGDFSSKARIPILTTLFSFLNENGSKVSITIKGGSRMNEKENSFGDRNIMDWTPMNIPGSKILFLVLEGKETTRSNPRKSLERVKSESR